MYNHKKIYSTLLTVLGEGPQSRKELIDGTILRLYGLSNAQNNHIGEYTELRGIVGSIVSEMESKGVIRIQNDTCSLITSQPIALRAENCEKEIIALLTKKPLTKPALRSALERYFGTDKTPTPRDDNTLYSLIGQVLKRLTALNIIRLEEGRYRIAPEKKAKIDDISEMLNLKADFLTRIHAKGGEFFEHYIMTLLGKYMAKGGKTVTENRTLGGSNDGGIDGLIKTVDNLGFRETVMVQAKNRTELSSETTVRGFYGAVCASQGTRGIFATTSDFHQSAKMFLDGIDNCVGINGEDIFRMAIECQYGFKRKSGKYVIDTRNL